MNEPQWILLTDPTPLLEFLRDSGRLTERKPRLFVVACCGLWYLLSGSRCSASRVTLSPEVVSGPPGSWKGRP
jgi:hypothetical protein